VIFTHDVEQSLGLLVALVNSGPSGTAGVETLTTVDDLAEFVEHNVITEVDSLTGDDVAAVHGLRERFRAVFAAKDSETAAPLINALTATAAVAPRLVDHDGYGWHIHHFVPGAALADHLAVDGGMALAHVVVAGEVDRLRSCAAPGCSNVLVDLSRNRSKRYCDSRTCGNRLHVAAYRERRRAAEAS
jgi:predicted RNA-binding Zn ribbon-like protein